MLNKKYPCKKIVHKASCRGVNAGLQIHRITTHNAQHR